MHVRLAEHKDTLLDFIEKNMEEYVEMEYHTGSKEIMLDILETCKDLITEYL